MISIIILTCDASNSLHSLLEAIRSQTIKDYELIVADSSLGDDTPQVARAYRAKVIAIDRSNFDHGAVRTLAAKEAQGDILVYLTQDALPCDGFAIENIVSVFSSNRGVGATFGRQIPYPGASIFAEHLRLFNYPDLSYRRVLEDRKKYGIRTAFLSNSFAAYRKSVLQEIGYFKEGLIFGEDTYAAARILLAGREIAYVAAARVFHSHDYSIWQDFKRYFDMGVFHGTEIWFLKEFGRAEAYGAEYVRSELRFLSGRKQFALMGEFVLRVIAKYLGYKLGKNCIWLPTRLAKRLSQNSTWWDRHKGCVHRS